MSEYVKTYINSQGKRVYKSIGSAVKATDGNRVSGYLVRFTNQDDPDLHGEYFDKSTNFWIKEHSPIGKPIMIDHAFDEKFKSVPVGIIDFMKEDEIGIWIDGKLKDRKEYEDMLRGWKDRKYISLDDSLVSKAAQGIENAVKAFFGTGKAQWSSGAFPQSVEIDDNTGHIKSWAFIEGTGVYTPAEPDGTEIKLKSAFQLLQDLLPNQLTDSPTGRKDASVHKDDIGASVDIEAPIEKSEQKETNMDNEETQKVENPAEILAGIAEQLIAIAQSMGASEEDAMAMTDEVMAEAKADAPPEEDPEAVAEKMFKRLIVKYEAKQANIKKAGNKLQSLANDYLKNQPATDFLPAYSGNGNGKASRISVSESLKFAHLSAMDMAMGWKIATAASPFSQTPQGLGGRKATDFVTADFYRHAVHKMAEASNKFNFSRAEDAIYIKSITPFKANELDASDITGQGLEYLGNAYDTMVWETARNNRIYQLMLSRGMMEKPVAQGMKNAVVPIEGNDPTVYGGVEGNSTDSTGRPEVVYKITPLTTSTVTVTPGTFRTATAYTFELGEDSFVDMASEANRKVREALEEHIEKAMINGDTETAASTNINDIAGTPQATGLTRDYFLEFNGLRKSPLVTSTAYSRNGGALTVADYRATWALLGSTQAPRKDKIFFLIDFNTFQASLDLLPTLTRDVAGEKAALFTGEFDELWGIPIYMSGFLALSNSAGKIDQDTPGNNTLGQILAVYAPYWAFVFKRNINIEMQRSPDSETYEFYGSMRFALQRRSASAAAISYNLTV